jgi:hypothetical protein
MTELETAYRKCQGQGVEVIAVCVWSDRSAYTAWMEKNRKNYTIQFAYDLAGIEREKSRLVQKLKVYSTPTTYVIDRNGVISDSMIGYSLNDARLIKALKKLKVSID